MERKLKLTPINPFTPRQSEVIELLANGLTQKQVASRLNLSYQTVKSFVCGNSSYENIYDRIERITGKRPHRNNLIALMVDDVLLFKTK